MWCAVTLVLAFSRRAMITSSLAQISTLTTSTPPPVVYFYGDVSVDSCFKLQSALREADVAAADSHPVCLRIQSFGGDVLPMLAVLDCIDHMNSPVWTYVDGYAASAATVLSVYGAKRFTSRRSVMLLHQLRAGSEGTLSSVENDVRLARGIAREVYGIYVKRTDLTEQGLAQLLARETWLDAGQALRMGLVDEIV